MGVQAKRIIKGQNIDVYSRPVFPVHNGASSVAVAFLSRWTAGTPLKVSVFFKKYLQFLQEKYFITFLKV